MNVYADFACELAEGVLWHPKEQIVYFVDIERGRLYRGQELLLEDEPMGGFTFQEDGSLLLFSTRGQVKRFRAGELSLLARVEGEDDTRFNDVIATPDGRVIAGSLSGKVYRFDPGGGYELLLQDIQQPNGMGFSPDERWLYFTESHAQTIHRFAYRDGRLSERVALVVTEENGVPDGLTVDAEGNLWSARWDGRVAICYDPSGKELRRVDFPAQNITSLTFGGPGYDRLFASSASPEGRIFQTEVGARGKPEFFSRI